MERIYRQISKTRTDGCICVKNETHCDNLAVFCSLIKVWRHKKMII